MANKYFKNLTEQERKQIKQNIFHRLKISENAETVTSFRWKRLWSVGIAASILAVASILVFNMSGSQSSQRVFIASTGNGEMKQIMLADSSIVILNANSSLHSNTGFSTADREVYLEGNGFFKVRKKASGQRFVVHADSVLVTVLGTEFNVNARESNIEVALTSGKVQVRNGQNDNHPQNIVPGERLRLDQAGRSFEKTSMDTALYSPWTKGEWNFKNTTLQEIALLLKEYYGVNVEFRNERSKDLKITAVIPVNTLRGLVTVIKETLLINITENSNRLTIQ